MTQERLELLFNQFDHSGQLIHIEELKSGHINDTYFVKTDDEQDYILQRINHIVFPNVPLLVRNKVLISNHLKTKTKATVLEFIPLKSKNQYYYFYERSYWNLMLFIKNSVTYSVVPNPDIAFEAGKLLGDFLNYTSDFDSSRLHDVIPNFHNMNFRFEQFTAALKGLQPMRLKQAKPWIDEIERLRTEMLIIQHLKDEGKIPIRVTHNDTKISNCLFDKKGKGICIIDTDTVMKGIVHYDFGDALRTICNSAKEDETDLETVIFDREKYDAYAEGFLSKTAESLTKLERNLLPLSVKTMIFIIGLRFLTDF